MPRLVSAIYHSTIHAAEYIADDGRHLIRTGGSLQWRINNGGDLASPMKGDVPAPKKTKGFIGFAKPVDSDLHFFIFPDYETGRAELKASLRRKYNNKTLSETIGTYVKDSTTDRYLSNLSHMAGVSKDTKICELNDDQLCTLMDGIERLEGIHKDEDTRKEIWVNVSHIQATDGTRPIAGEEIVIRSEGKESTLKSNSVGQFPPIVHGKGNTEVHHKTVDGELKKVGELPEKKGQHWHLLSKISEYFGTSVPVKPPENPIGQKQPLLYPVKQGDTLGDIAKHFKTSVAQLKKDNRLTKDTILAGQVLGINGSPPAMPAAAHPKKAALKAIKPVAAPAATSGSPGPASNPKPKPIVLPEAQTVAARSKEGKGEPLALITPEDGVAPWMKYALAEAKKFHGEPEKVIQKTTNYHTEIKDGRTSMADTPNAWCAAFVNWCLMKAGYPIENPKETGFIDRAGAMARADSFAKVKGKRTDKKQADKDVPYMVNPLYVQIEEPIYGAIAIETNSNGHGHHAGFAYGRCASGDVCLLGGNQHDRIKFSPFIEKERKVGKHKSDHLQFFVPAAYFKSYEQTKKELPNVDIGKLNKAIGITAKTEATEGTT